MGLEGNRMGWGGLASGGAAIAIVLLAAELREGVGGVSGRRCVRLGSDDRVSFAELRR